MIAAGQEGEEEEEGKGDEEREKINIIREGIGEGSGRD